MDLDPQHLKTNPETLRAVLLEVEGFHNALVTILSQHGNNGCSCELAPGLNAARRIVAARLRQLQAIGAPVRGKHVN